MCSVGGVLLLHRQPHPAMTLQLNGITYNVVRTIEFNHNGCDRVEFVMKRPRGRVEYRVVRYENGTYSNVW